MFNTLYNSDTGQYAIEQPDGMWKIAKSRLQHPETGQYAYEFDEGWQLDEQPAYYEGQTQQPDSMDTAYDAVGVDETAPVQAEPAPTELLDAVGGTMASFGGTVQNVAAMTDEIVGKTAKMLKTVGKQYFGKDAAINNDSFWDTYNNTSPDIWGVDYVAEANKLRDNAAFNKKLAQEALPDNEVGKFLQEVVYSGADMIPAIVTGGTSAYAIIGAQVFSNTYATSINEGKTIEKAMEDAALATTYELTGEKIFGFLDNIGASSGLRHLFEQTAREAGSEMVTESLTVVDEYTRQGMAPDKFDMQKAVEIVKRVELAGLAGALMGGGLQAHTVGRAAPQQVGDITPEQADEYRAQNEAESVARSAAEADRQAKLAGVTQFDVEMPVQGQQTPVTPVQTEPLAIPNQRSGPIDPMLDPTSPEAIARAQEASDSLDESYDVALERLEPRISPFDQTLPAAPAGVEEMLPTKRLTPRVEGVTEGMPQLINPKTGEAIPNPPVMADSSGEALSIPERGQAVDFGFDPKNVRDISQPTRTLYADLDALATELLEIDTMPLDELITRIQTDMPVDAARYFETEPDTGKAYVPNVAPFNLVSRMTTEEVLANMDAEDRLRYHSAKNMDEKGMILAEFRTALKDARKEEAEAEFGSQEEMFRTELRRQATQRYEKDDRTLFEMTGRETTDYAGVNPEELAELTDTKRADQAYKTQVRHAKELDATREDAVAIASTIMETGVPYINRPSKTKPENRDPGWSVIAVEPIKGRVYAQYETKGGGTYIVTWRIGDTKGTVQHARTSAGKILREGTNKGLETLTKTSSQSGDTPFLDTNGEPVLREKGGLPDDFRHQVDKMAIAAMTSADGVIKTPARGKEHGIVATIPFEGTKPMRFSVREQQRLAVKSAKAQADKYNKPTEEDLLKVREQAAQDAEKMQGKVRKQLEKNTKERGGELVTLPNVKGIPQDLGGKNITLIDQAAKTRLQRSESVEEFATQILPDGAIRTIKLVPNKAGTKYMAVAMSRGLNNFKTPHEMGDTTLNINMKRAEEAKANTAKAKRLDVIRTKAMEAQDTDAQREAKLELARLRGDRVIKSAAATAKAKRSQAAKSLPGSGSINLQRAEGKATDYSEPANKILDELIRQTKQRANDPATGKFLPVSVRDLKQKKQEILTLLRAGIDKATPADERAGQITTEYEGGTKTDPRTGKVVEYLEAVVIQDVFGINTSVDDLTQEQLHDIYKTDEWLAAAEEIDSELKDSVDDLTTRELALSGKYDADWVTGQIKLGRDWGDAVEAAEFRQKGASRTKGERQLKRAQAQSMREQRSQLSVVDNAREFEQSPDLQREETTERVLSRRGRLRPTAEEGPVDNLAEKAVKDLSAQIEQDKKDAALDAKIAATKGKEMLLKLKEIDKDNKSNKKERKREVVKQQEQIDKLTEIVEQDKLARQMERLQDKASLQQVRDSEGKPWLEYRTKAEEAEEDIGVQPEQLDLGVPDVFAEPPAQTAEVAEVPLSPPQIKRQQAKAKAAAKKLKEEQKKAAKRRAAKQKKKDSESILKLVGVRNFGKASSWKSIGTDVAVREGRAYLQDMGISLSALDPVTQRELQWNQEYGQEMQQLMADVWAKATPEQRAESTVDPTPEHIEAASDTLDPNTKDITERTLFLGKHFIKARMYAHKMRQLFGYKRGMNKGDGTLSVRKSFEKWHGEALLFMEEGTRLDLRLEAQLRKDGWPVVKGRSIGQMEAVNDYLDGMRPSSIQKKWGITFSPDAIARMDAINQHMISNRQAAAKLGVFADDRIRALASGDGTYWHASSARIRAAAKYKGLKKWFGKDPSFTPKERQRLYDLAIDGLGIPMTEAEINEMSKSQLKAAVQRFSVYTENLENEEDSSGDLWDYATREDGSKVRLFRKHIPGKTLVWDKDIATEDLREFVKSVEITDEHIHHMVDAIIASTVDSGQFTGAADRAVAGTSTSIQQVRTYLKSDSQAIHEILGRLGHMIPHKGTEKSEWASALEALKLTQETYESMGVEEFFNAYAEQNPEKAGKIDKEQKKHAFNSAMKDALWEEIEPSAKTRQTRAMISEGVAITRYLSDVASDGLEQGWAGLAADADKNLVRLAEPDTPLGKSGFLLNGSQYVGSQLFVREDVKDAILHFTGGIHRETSSGLQTYFRASGYAKYGVIVHNPEGLMRNFASTGLLYAGTGSFLDPKGLSRGLRVGARQLQTAWSIGGAIRADAKQRKMTQRLSDAALKRGLLHDGAMVGSVNDALSRAGDDTDVFLMSTEYAQAGAMLGRRAKSMASRAGAGTVKSVQRMANSVFRLGDEMLKVSMLSTKTEQYLILHGQDGSLLKRYLKGERMSAEDTATVEQAMDVAAEGIKNSLPTFSRTPPAVKSLSRNPFVGAFPSFMAEVLRTIPHNVAQNVLLMSGRTSDGKQVPSNQRARAMALGGIQMAALYAFILSDEGALAKLWDGLRKAAYWAFGDDDDEYPESVEERDIFDDFMPWYMQDGSNHYYDLDKENREVKYTVTDYAAPTGGWKKAWKEEWNEYWDLIDAGDPRDVYLAIAGAVQIITKGLGNEEIVPATIAKRFGQKGMPKSLPDAKLSKKIGDSAEYMTHNTVATVFGEGFLAEAGGAVAGAAGELFPGVKYAEGAVGTAGAVTGVGSEDGMTGAELVNNVALRFTGGKSGTWVFDRDYPRNLKQQKSVINIAQRNQLTGIKLTKASTQEEYTKQFRIADAARRVATEKMTKGTQSVRKAFGISDGRLMMAFDDADIKSSIAGMSRGDIAAGQYQPIAAQEVQRILLDERKRRIKDGEEELTLDRINEIFHWHIQAIIHTEDL